MRGAVCVDKRARCDLGLLVLLLAKRFKKRNRPIANSVLQPELGATLARIQKAGAAEFYTGETARLIAADMDNAAAPPPR